MNISSKFKIILIWVFLLPNSVETSLKDFTLNIVIITVTRHVVSPGCTQDKQTSYWDEEIKNN